MNHPTPHVVYTMGRLATDIWTVVIILFLSLLGTSLMLMIRMVYKSRGIAHRWFVWLNYRHHWWQRRK